MTPDAAGIEAALADVLADHELVGKSVPAGDDHDCRLIFKPRDGCGCTRIVVGCTGCDWISEADGTQGDAHRAHQAAALLPVVTQAQAEALREAADAMGRAARDGGSHWRAHAWANWLRARADESGAR